jgi:hypothetical protein
MNLFLQNKILKISLNGGLGNQMFQYAFGRSLSLHLGSELSLDVSGFERDHFYKRNYELGVFNLDKNITISNNKICSLIAWKINDLKIKNIISDSMFGKKFIIEGSPEKFLKRFSYIEAPGYVAGYWQNEHYFVRFKKVIKSDFEIFVKLSDSTKAFAKIIQATKTPVSIHVRRNHEKSPDDISENNNKKITNTIEYYKKSIDFISRKIDSPFFFIFSDNQEWARKNLSFISNANFIDSADRPGFEDLYLMTRCHHHIIANSSFSWWGAWLSINENNQIVIAPKNVIYTPPIPSAWIAI